MEQKNMILGRTDITLNETGIMQAKKLRDNIPYPIKYVIASPLQRAAMTANIVCENLNVEIKYDDRLMEMDFGTFEGVTELVKCTRWKREISSLGIPGRVIFSSGPEGL